MTDFEGLRWWEWPLDISVPDPSPNDPKCVTCGAAARFDIVRAEWLCIDCKRALDSETDA